MFDKLAREYSALQKSNCTLERNRFISSKESGKFFLTVLLLLFTLVGNATTYYISTTGDNGNDGSIGNPWATLAYAATQATSPGDTIHVTAGEYTETNYATVGVGVSIVGADSATTIINYTYVGTEYQACIRLQSATEGTDGSQIIKNITFDGGLTASVAIAVFARSNVEISYCSFKDFYYKGVYIVGRAMGQTGEPTTYATGNSFHHNTIDNCSLYATNGRGGLNVGGQDGLLIYDNVITQTGRASGSNGYPIKYYNNGYLRGCKIYNNIIRNAVDRSMEFSIEWWNSYGTEIYNNDITGSIDFNWVNKDTFEYGAYVHDNNFTAPNYDHAFGVRFEFSCNDIIVEKNSFDFVGVVFHFSSRTNEDYNNIRLSYNVANHIGRTGSTRAGKFVLFTGDSGFEMDSLFILNNTIVGRNDNVDSLQYYAILMVNNTSTTNTKITNNIITNFSYRPVMIYGNIATNFDFKNNLIYNSGNSNDIYIDGSNPTNYSKSGNIAGRNPLFVSATDLQLQSTSPAKNTGIDVGLTTDFEGNSIIGMPDIGACEYQSETEDNSKPVVTTFSIPSTSSSLVIPVNSFTATDNVAVTGFKITESAVAPLAGDAGWTAGAPTSYTFASEGTKTLYAWVKDAKGNISAPVSESVVITLSDSTSSSPDLTSTYSEYLFEESTGTTVFDSQGVNHGVITNEGSRISGVNGKGLEFTGTGYISLGQSFSDNVRDEVTLNAWVNPYASSSDWQGIIMHGGPNIDSYALYINPDSKSIGFKTTGTTSPWDAIDNVDKLWDGSWHQITVTYNGTEKVIYLDGEVLLNINVTGLIESGEGYNLYIGAGRDQQPPTLLYNGLIDEVRIYNYALSSSEINQLYNLVDNKLQAIYFTEDISICEGESYWGWTQSGQYQRTLIADSGADSIITTNLTVNPVYHIFEDITILEGENYMGWTEPGEYERNLISVTGCDSTVTTNLTVASSTEGNSSGNVESVPVYFVEDINICEGESYMGWTETGTYERILTAASGADSIVTTNLTVNLVYNVSEDITITEGESYMGWVESGQYERNLTSITGCDSIVVTNLLVESTQSSQQTLTQTIELEKGWNIFSSYVVPEDSSIEAIHTMLSSSNLLVEVEDELGNTYEKKGKDWTNNIGSIRRTEGYKIKVKNTTTLKLSGSRVNLPMSINLFTGWNLISFPNDESVNAMDVIQPLIDNGALVKVQDEKGNSIENWGTSVGWINGIGDFNAGEGYFVQVNTNCVLPIQSEYLKSATKQLTNDSETEYFKVKYDGNGNGHMNINVIGLTESNLQVGDEVAVFDGQVCVGAVKLSDDNIYNNIVSISASVTDKDTLNGFTEGSPIKLLAWYADNDEIVSLTPDIIGGELYFETQGSVFIGMPANITTGNIELEKIDITLFPNPARDKVTIQFSKMPEQGTRIQLLDMTGKQLIDQIVESPYEELNVQSQPAGIYLVKVVTATNYKIDRLVIN